MIVIASTQQPLFDEGCNRYVLSARALAEMELGRETMTFPLAAPPGSQGEEATIVKDFIAVESGGT